MDPYQSPQVDPFEERDLEQQNLTLAELTHRETVGQLHYLLLAAGFFLAWCMSTSLREAFEFRQFSWRLWPQVLQAVLSAAPLAALGLAAWRRHERATTFPTQFGHWLLLIQATKIVGDSLGLPIVQWPGMLLILAMTYCYSQGLTFWRIFAGLWFLRVLLEPIFAQLFVFGRPDNPFFTLDAIPLLLSLLTMVSFLVAAVRDLVWFRRGKDSLHWLGIAQQIALTAWPRLLRITSQFYFG